MIVDPENMRRLNKMFNIRLKLDTQLDELGINLWQTMKFKFNFNLKVQCYTLMYS